MIATLTNYLLAMGLVLALNLIMTALLLGLVIVGRKDNERVCDEC